jgi:signal recognition particle receptor subunit beta
MHPRRCSRGARAEPATGDQGSCYDERSVSSIDRQAREISFKVVYYGPGLGGKTSSLQTIHRSVRPDSRGQLVSLATGSDRTLFFDFLPLKVSKVRGFSVRLQLYTVPGQVHYNSTRKLVLAGADAVVFVADSQPDRAVANEESLDNLRQNLLEQGMKLRDMPFVIQYNKRDAPDALPIDELEAQVNEYGVPAYETIATTGHGVLDALKTVTKLLLEDMRRKGGMDLPGNTGSLPTVPAANGSPPERRSGPVSVPSAGGKPQVRRAITLTSLGQMADVIETLNEEDEPDTDPGAASTGMLCELVHAPEVRDAIAAVESDLRQGNWQEALWRAVGVYHDLSFRLAGSLARDDKADAPALAAVLSGMPATRFLRFREIEGRVVTGGAVTSEEALFALFFLTDLALRATEEAR